jgi:hypothetical protein
MRPCTIASIIEKEAGYDDERTKNVAVFINPLKEGNEATYKQTRLRVCHLEIVSDWGELYLTQYCIYSRNSKSYCTVKVLLRAVAFLHF